MNEIEKIFVMYESNKKIKSMDYSYFINDLISEFTNEIRLRVIRYIYETIEERGVKFNREIDITFLKEIYNAKNNYFKKEEADNRLEFEDCLELYHYVYKGKKLELFSKSDFIEFYKCISFLIYSDIDFMKLISNEWRVPFEYIQNEFLGPTIQNREEINLNNSQNNYINDHKIENNINDNIPKKSKLIERLINNDFDKENKDVENIQKPLFLLFNILKRRGLRGILYLHLEFINSCKDLSKITIDDFINIMQIQHINLSESDFKNIFNSFSSKKNNNYLDFSAFIRNFKKELNDNKLSSVEQAFTVIDKKGNDMVPLNFIKKTFKCNNHPEVLNGSKNEEEILLEFLDCFNINYEILNLDSKSQISNEGQNIIDFEIFANFYEYVSFIYPNDKDFDNIVRCSWN